MADEIKGLYKIEDRAGGEYTEEVPRFLDELTYDALDNTAVVSGTTFATVTSGVTEHTIASHSDTTAAGSELDTLTDGSNADALHGHNHGVETDGSLHATATALVNGFMDSTDKVKLNGIEDNAEVNNISDGDVTTLTTGGSADSLHSHNLAENIPHSGLTDMPDVSGTITDHDARYYTQSQVDTISGTLSVEINTDITAHAGDADIHHTESHTIASHNDTTASGSELNTLTDGSNADALHTHTLAEAVTHADLSDMPDIGGTNTDHDNRYYTQSQIDTISGTLSSEIDSDISTHAGNTDVHHAELHTIESHSGTTASGSELNTLTDGSNADTLHTHTLAEAVSHADLSDMPDVGGTVTDHDNRYYTQSQVDTISGTLSSEIDSDISTHAAGADHDGRYYTESEVDSELSTLSGTLSSEIDSDISTHAGNADVHHTEAHTISSHSDTVASGTQLDTLVGGGNADVLHTHTLAEQITHAGLSDMPDGGGTNTDHDARYYTQSQVDTISGTLSSEIDSDISTHSSSADHDGRYYTESEIGTTASGTSGATLVGVYDEFVNSSSTQLQEVLKDLDGAIDNTRLLSVVFKTSAYTAVSGDYLIICDATGGAFTVMLPTAVGISGKSYIIKKTDSSVNAVTLDADGTETIDGDLTQDLDEQYDAIRVVSDGSNWHVI